LSLSPDETRLYVVDGAGMEKNIFVIDIITYRVIGIIDGCESPETFAFNSTGTRLFVGNGSGGDYENPISIIVDTITLQVIATFLKDCFIESLILNTAGTRLYVVYHIKEEIENYYVSVIDTNNNRIIKTILVIETDVIVGDHVGKTMLNAAETQLYVLDRVNGNLLVIHTVTYEVKRIPIGKKIVDMVIAQAFKSLKRLCIERLKQPDTPLDTKKSFEILMENNPDLSYALRTDHV
jgi:DNA-binding beta-propeller fold protein YncE